MKKLDLLDSTLRDGAQGEGVAFSVDDKLNVTRALDDLGISYIEAGNPASNPKDFSFFERAAAIPLRHARLVAFGSTRRKGITVQEDAGCRALLAAGTQTTAVFGKSWDMHVTEILHCTLEENLQMIADTLSFLKKMDKEVFFDAEHFFDGYKHNPRYALETLRAALSAGADCVVLCDTNGGCFPDEIRDITAAVKRALSCTLGIHCHNDMNCAVANTLLAVEAGATHIQGTYTGIGERCGNTNLSSVIASLQLKRGYSCIPSENMKNLTKTARYLSEMANMMLSAYMPYVGKSAFSHKGGMHVDGVSKLPRSFEHIPPELVGNRRGVVLSEVSGKSAVLSKLHEIDKTLTKQSPQAAHFANTLKELEYKGFAFESAGASLELLALKELGRFDPYFQVDHFKIVGEQFFGRDEKNPSCAIVKVSVGDRAEIAGEEGEGPVHALDKALRRALGVFYPALSHVRLIDYRVRVMEPRNATAAAVRVLIETTDGDHVWTTVGASRDIIGASFRALTDSMEYKLLKDGQDWTENNG